METMNLLDITIKYFNVIVFVMCVIFGMISFFASWVAWREIHHKRNIMRSVIAAYNITEDTVEKSRTSTGELEIDPAVLQTVFNSLQEVLNAVYGELTGRSIPPRDERAHGTRKAPSSRSLGKILDRRRSDKRLDADHEVPSLLPDEREQPQEPSQV
jgi:hypothetical protein